MRNTLLPAIAVFFTSLFSAQSYENRVGINTQTPNTTLDVTAPNDNQHPAGIQAPRLTRAELTNKGNTLYGNDQKGTLIYISDVSGGNTLGPRALITEIGYYYFDGYLWQRAVTTTEYSNIYIKDGALTGNRVVTQENKTLTFTGTATGGTIFRNTTGTSTNQQAALRIIDGGQDRNKVLTSDADGNATWQDASASVVIGTFSDVGLAKIDTPVGTSHKTGATITLPPGIWAVNLGVELDVVAQQDPPARGGYWNVAFLSPRTEDSFSGTNTQLGSHSANTPYLAAGYIDAGYGKQNLSGSYIMTVRGNAPVTFNLYFYPSGSRGAGVGNFPAAAYYQNAFRADSENTYLYAVKLAQ